MRDPHQRVVDGVDQGVEGMTVAPHQHVVGHVLGQEGDLSADQVGEHDRLVRHPEAQHRSAALGPQRRGLVLGQVAAVAVVPAGLVLRAGRLAALLDLLLGAEAVVGMAGLP